MNKLLLLFVFGFSIVAHATEYRSFADKEGREIKAKIIKVNKGTKKVTLERENKKQATVSISIFSKTDQEYIYEWSPFTKKSEESPSAKSKAGPNTLPESEVREIAEKYLSIVKNGKNKISDKNMTFFMPIVKSNRGGTFRKAKIKEIQENNVIINLTSERLGYLQLTEDGAFKYDGLYCLHPIHEAFLHCDKLRVWSVSRSSSKIIAIREESLAYSRLRETGVPTFNYSPELDKTNKTRELKKINDWLLENGETWNKSDPKIPLPKEVFEELHEKYRYRYS